MKKVLIILAPGFEEIEALSVVDLLRRAGADLMLAGTVDGVIRSKNNINVLADDFIENISENTYDMIVLPGGSIGTENLKKDERVKKILEIQHSRGGIIAAICAAPSVLARMGIISGKRVTSHPTVKDQLKNCNYSEERVVEDGNIITSRGPGTAIEFGFHLIERLYGPERVEEVNEGVLAILR